MHEYALNLHMHTVYSDGRGTHADIVQAALEAGLDAVIVTDHNLLVHGLEGYYEDSGRRVLLLIGEEIHDQTREPQKNHMLVFGAGRELAPLAQNPQNLINGVAEAGGICFLAHPIDPPAEMFGEGSLAWVSWDISGYTGIELWNGLTEFKSHLKNYLYAIWYAYNFKQVAYGPFVDTLSLWDKLLAKGQQVVAIGGSDAHERIGRLGPLRRMLFPYQQHFQAVNTHILAPEPFNGELAHDRALVLNALRQGNCFVGYDLPTPTRGFRFNAHMEAGTAMMGDLVELNRSVTLQVKLPYGTECHLLKDGETILSGRKRQALVYKVDQPGVYRVEAYIRYKGKRRGWIFSNPIYVRG
ncbi:CehA/McbA family metallohydrolase [Chloroflexota bacterium]